MWQCTSSNKLSSVVLLSYHSSVALFKKSLLRALNSVKLSGNSAYFRSNNCFGRCCGSTNFRMFWKEISGNRVPCLHFYVCRQRAFVNIHKVTFLDCLSHFLTLK